MGSCSSTAGKTNRKDKTTYQLNITTRTTVKVLNYLFDINDTSTIIKHDFKISEPGFLVRNDTEVAFNKIKNSKFAYPNGETILNIKLKNNHLSISKPFVPKTQDGVNLEIEKQMQEMPWILAKRPDQKKDWKGLKIKKGDIVRFGRIKFRVKAKNPLLVDSRGRKINLNETISDASSVEENNQNSSVADTERLEDEINRTLRTRSESLDVQYTGRDPQNRIATMINLDQKENLNVIEEKEQANEIGEMAEQNPEKLDFEEADSAKSLSNENKACRICLWDDEEDENPIIQPCKCKGTMKNVHINCFKRWMGKKVDRKTSQSMVSVFWKRLQCEICHMEISHTLEWKSKNYDLVDVPAVDAPNLVLEYFHHEKVLGYHVIKFDPQEPKKMFGRGSQCDIRVHDNTVSREHAQIYYVNRRFYLIDLDSKYGTSILLDETRNLIKASNQFSLQVGRTIIDCHVTKIKAPKSIVHEPIRVHPANENLKVSTDRLSLRTNTLHVSQQSKAIQIQENIENRNSNAPNRGSRSFQSRPTIVQEEERKDGN